MLPDIRSYAWSQTGDLLSQIIKKTSVFRSKKNLKQLAGLNTSDSSPPQNRVPSRLRYTVEPATPLEEEAQNIVALARAISRSDPTSPISRAVSRNIDPNGPSVLGVSMSDAVIPANGDEEEAEHEDHSMKGAVKGFLGKLRPKHHSRHDSFSPHGSTEDVSDRRGKDRADLISCHVFHPSREVVVGPT